MQDEEYEKIVAAYEAWKTACKRAEILAVDEVSTSSDEDDRDVWAAWQNLRAADDWEV